MVNALVQHLFCPTGSRFPCNSFYYLNSGEGTSSIADKASAKEQEVRARALHVFVARNQVRNLLNKLTFFVG